MTKKVLQFSKYSGKFIKEYNSISEAGKLLKIDSSQIAKVCKKKQSSAGDFIWRYKTDFVK